MYLVLADMLGIDIPSGMQILLCMPLLLLWVSLLWLPFHSGVQPGAVCLWPLDLLLVGMLVLPVLLCPLWLFFAWPLSILTGGGGGLGVDGANHSILCRCILLLRGS